MGRLVTKDEYGIYNAARIRAFPKIAKALGEKHPVTKMMGSLAWGRHNAERGPSDTSIRDYAEEFGYLDGYCDALKRWARENNDDAAMNVINALYPSGYREGPLG